MKTEYPKWDKFPHVVLIEPERQYKLIENFPETEIKAWCKRNIGAERKAWVSQWRWYAFSSFSDMIMFKLVWEQLSEKYLFG